jgi:hypothetical protein
MGILIRAVLILKLFAYFIKMYIIILSQLLQKAEQTPFKQL